jgi:hypothetical protein
MLKLVLTALALLALLATPALPQSASGAAAKTAASKAHAGKKSAVKKPAAKARAAKKASRHAAKPKFKGRKAARGKAGKRRGAVAVKPVKLTPEKRAALLEDAAALNEDLIGFALDGKAGKVSEKVLAMRRMLPVLRGVLAAEAFEELIGHVARMEQGAASNDILAAALDSAEAFRTLQQAVEPAQRALPLDVSILDYAGYRLTVLIISPDPDWAKIAAAAKDSSVAWSRLEEKVQDAKLQNLLETIQTGLRDAVLRKDVQGVKVALKKQIDAIDALDRHFSSIKKPPAEGSQ